MNSEELELSLRTEFESYLKDVLARMKQDVSDFQQNFETEFEKHKAQLDEAIRNLSTRFESGPDFDRAFVDAITEHLRLARDAGATVAAEAFGEAEKLKSENPPPAGYDRIRDAIKDISGHMSQAAILKSLVEHAGEFAPRGAFFIIRNDHFVGWKAFGMDGLDDASVQSVRFPVSADTILSSAASSLGVSEGNYTTHADDGSSFLEPLGFDRPDRMVAIPLVARGRGVAVLYADYGTSGVNLDTDALEALMSVAGLTVELRAAANEARPQNELAAPTESANEKQTEAAEPQQLAEVGGDEKAPAEAAVETVEEYTGAVAVEADAPEASEPEAAEKSDESDQGVTYFEPESEAVFESDESSDDFASASSSPFETTESGWKASEKEEVAWVAPAASPEPVREYSINGSGGSSVEVAAIPAVRSRAGERVVDLPIEVSDDERQMHVKASRFARLLVSEIKLYNEQKVNEGRQANDLYDRLRDAIDRSREMYEKRVQPEVASKFDYFHYELVNGLAEGKNERLGQSYPGAAS